MPATLAPAVEDEIPGSSSPYYLLPTYPPADSVFPAAPVPVLAPYLGLVCAVLSMLVGGWLVLAPYAFDYRAGAAKPPRTTLVDLATGAAVVAIGAIATLLFGRSLSRRLRSMAPEFEVEPELEIEPEPEPAPAPVADPDGGLRDLLAPLVAALAADLRSRKDGEQ